MSSGAPSFGDNKRYIVIAIVAIACGYAIISYYNATKPKYRPYKFSRRRSDSSSRKSPTKQEQTTGVKPEEVAAALVKLKQKEELKEKELKSDGSQTGVRSVTSEDELAVRPKTPIIMSTMALSPSASISSSTINSPVMTANTTPIYTKEKIPTKEEVLNSRSKTAGTPPNALGTPHNSAEVLAPLTNSPKDEANKEDLNKKLEPLPAGQARLLPSKIKIPKYSPTS